MSTHKPVRIGVVSTAKIAREKVIPGFRTTPWLEVAAIASRNIDTAKTTAAALGIPVAHGSYEALFADPTIEAVYIPTPNDSHVDLTLAAARAGKHVLCEKPAAMNAGDAERLAALPPGIVYLEAFMVRYHPQWLKTRELVRTGAIGRVAAAQSFFSYFLDDPANIRNKPENGGGGLWDIGVYPIVTARFVFDAEPKRVIGLIELDKTFGTDVLTSAILDFGEGRHLTFTVGTQTVPHQRVNVVGSTGRIEVLIPFNAPADAGNGDSPRPRRSPRRRPDRRNHPAGLRPVRPSGRSLRQGDPWHRAVAIRPAGRGQDDEDPRRHRRVRQDRPLGKSVVR